MSLYTPCTELRRRSASRVATGGLDRWLRRLPAVALVGGFLVGAPLAEAADSGGRLEKVRIAASQAPVALPLYVAQRRGFFVDAGLDVSIEDCIGGTRCLRKLLDGQADVVTTSEMPVVLQSFSGDDVAIVATMVHASDNLKLIARRGSGIAGGEQLEGRNVGVIAGTAAQFLLETHLLTVGVDPRHVVMVPLQAEDTVAALQSGRIDALAVWEPFGYEALHGTEPAGVRLPLGSGYIESYNLVTRRATLSSRDEMLVRLLRAVDRAEQFIQAHPADAQAVLRERLKLDQRFVDWVWSGLGFRLSLDQSLVSTMESETRWAQREGHVRGGTHRDVLTLVYPGPLEAVRPSAVGMAH
jgi:ABC-type nitrate/sulfonate/bicarbonate transport system substrate-binding protein